MKCPHCGGEHPDTANFCPKSGKKLSENFRRCPNPECNAENIPNSFTFCPYCGASLAEQYLQDQEDVNFRAALGEGGADLENPHDKFLMIVLDIFTISGKGVVVTGGISSGAVKVDSNLELLGNGKSYNVKVAGIERNRSLVDKAERGDVVGVLLTGVDYRDVVRGSVLTERGFLKNGTRFKANVYLFPESSGGRHGRTGVDYTPWIYVRNMEVPGSLVPVSDTLKGIGPDENAEVDVRLTFSLPMKEGTRFAIRENGRTVGAGIVTKVNN